MSKLLFFVKYGWSSADTTCYEYSHVKNDLSIHNDVVLFRNRIIIPTEIRHEILKILHVTHNGIVSMKTETRQSLWWPNINSDIEVTVKSCNQCCFSNNKLKETKLTWEDLGAAAY